MSKERVLKTIFQQTGVSPVLVDIGSAGHRPSTFAALAPHSTMVGFDPDHRGQDMTFAGGCQRSVLVPKAVVASAEQTSIDFILTKSPYCSSTLEPNSTSLREFIFADFFSVVRRVQVPTITLNAVVTEFKLPRMDWIKIDTQGTDLSILKSLNSDVFDHVLAVDIEPGLIAAYQGEDMFGETHHELTSRGFWLADLKTQSYPRIRPETAAGLKSQLGPFNEIGVFKSSPTCCEARYFRTIPYLENLRSREAFVLAFAFAVCDDSLGYAFDLVAAYERCFEQDANWSLMKAQAEALLKNRIKGLYWARMKSRLQRTFDGTFMKRVIHRILSQQRVLPS